MDKNNSLDPWFISGFADAEAAFTFSRSGNGFALYFSVRQRHDNREIIEKIQRYFRGVGKIYFAKEALPARYSGHTQPSVYYRVCKQTDLMCVIEHFDKFPLQSKKREAYNVWRAMVIEKTRFAINCSSDQFKIFAEKLSSLNPKTRAFKKHSR
jgi:hypothetical protein